MTAAPVADEEDKSAQVAPMRRFGPAIMLSQLGVNMAVLTQLQLLLALHLNTIAGTGATSAFGVVTGFGALCATVSSPIVGASPTAPAPGSAGAAPGCSPVHWSSRS